MRLGATASQFAIQGGLDAQEGMSSRWISRVASLQVTVGLVELVGIGAASSLFGRKEAGRLISRAVGGGGVVPAWFV